MTTWKRQDFDRAFPADKPTTADPAIRLFVFAGKEESLSRDLAGRALRTLADPTDPMSVCDITPGDLAADPARLADEAASVPMFGGVRVIRVSGVTESIAEAARLLLAAPAAGNPAIFIAADLAKTSALKKLVEDSPYARILISYPLEARDASRWMKDATTSLGLRPEPGVSERMVAASDGDVGVLTQELEKFALFLDASPETPKRLTLQDFAALGADSADDDMNALVQAITVGDLKMVERHHALLAGSSAIPALRAMARRLLLLADCRAQMEAGASASDAVSRARPPLFFKERDAVANSLASWPARRIRAGLSAMLAAEEAIKMPASAGDALGWQALLLLAVPTRLKARQ